MWQVHSEKGVPWWGRYPPPFFAFFVLFVLSAHIKRCSVSRMQDFSDISSGYYLVSNTCYFMIEVGDFPNFNVTGIMFVLL